MMSCRTKAVEGGARDEMSLDVEDVVNGGVDRDEALGRADRLEALHLALSSAYLSLLKSPSGHGIGLPKKAMADDFGLSNSAVLPCEPVCAHGF